MKISLGLVCLLLIATESFAQTNDSPAGAYQWKRGKTEFQEGYVVLKSGKRMDGKISLKGSPDAVSEISYQGGGKDLTFPAGSLQAYGLVNVNPNASSVAGGSVNESPETMYTWRNMGIVMNKVITVSVPRAGYVVLRNGTRHEGEIKLRRKDGALDNIEVQSAASKQKFDADEIARYGYTVSQEEVAQDNLARESKTFYQGSITTASGKAMGEIAVFPIEGKRYTERVVFKDKNGQLTEHTPASSSGYSYIFKGREYTVAVVDRVFVPEWFNGSTFQLYRNPKPTTINEFATSIAKGAMQVGTTAAATTMVKKDQEKNDYVSNLDSVLRVSSTEDLIKLRDQLTALSGYATAQEAIDNSDNESLRTNLSAIELTIQGRQASATPGGILNDEWIILNRKTGEKTVVYKSKYKDQIDVLLMGCDKYLELPRSSQNDLQKWENVVQAVKLLDSCY